MRKVLWKAPADNFLEWLSRKVFLKGTLDSQKLPQKVSQKVFAEGFAEGVGEGFTKGFPRKVKKKIMSKIILKAWALAAPGS